MTSSKRGVSDSRFATKQVHLIRKRGMVTLPIAEEIVAFDDYLRFGTGTGLTPANTGLVE